MRSGQMDRSTPLKFSPPLGAVEGTQAPRPCIVFSVGLLPTSRDPLVKMTSAVVMPVIDVLRSVGASVVILALS
jgi:hypothetical protein